MLRTAPGLLLPGKARGSFLFPAASQCLPGPDRNDKRRQVNEKTNEIFKKLADGKDIYYLDIGPQFLQEDGTLTREIMPDLLHLSKKGYTIWAESIEPTLEKLMGEK